MKTRLFFLLSSGFMLTGLLLPVGIYAGQATPTQTALEVADDASLTIILPCIKDESGECKDVSNGAFIRVSWNS